MITKGHFQHRTATIPANGEESFIIPDSNFIKCTNSDGANFRALCDQVEMVLFGGFDYTFPEGDTFSQVRLINPNENPITVDLYFGKGSIRDNNLSISQNHFYPSISQGGTHCETFPSIDFSDDPVKLFDANPRTVHVAISAVGGPVYVGGSESDVDLGRGLVIPDGETRILQTSAELWAYGSGGTTATRARFFF
jgi:hypothetical protein